MTNARPAPHNGTSAPPAGHLTFIPLAEALGLSVRSLRRFVAQGVIEPAQPGAGRRGAAWDPVAVARALLAHHPEETPRDRKDVGQAKLFELKYAKESRQLLDRDDVVRRGVAVATALRAHLEALPSAMVRKGIIPPGGEAAVADYIHERLDELARLKSADYLVGVGAAAP